MKTYLRRIFFVTCKEYYSTVSQRFNVEFKYKSEDLHWHIYSYIRHEIPASFPGRAIFPFYIPNEQRGSQGDVTSFRDSASYQTEYLIPFYILFFYVRISVE